MTTLRDAGLKRTFAPLEQRLQAGETLNDADIQSLIQSANDGPGVTATERRDLDRLLSEHGARMTPEARSTLANFVSSQSGGTPGGVSPLTLQIRNAGIRNALTGADGGSAILADSQVHHAEARRLLEIVNANGILSGREQRDLKALLTDPSVVIEGPARAILEQAVGVFIEPAAHAQVTGSQVNSAHVDLAKSYRKEGFSLELYQKLGAPQAVLDVMRRADELTGSGDADGKLSLEELVGLEHNAALLPAELDALKKAYALLEVSPLSAPAAPPAVAPLVAEDLSVRPGAIDLSAVEIAVQDLPAGLHAHAQRARLIAQGAAAGLDKVTLADVQYAIAQDHQESTPADRAAFENELLPALRNVAVERLAPSYEAKVRISDLGEKNHAFVDTGRVRIGVEERTALRGKVIERGFWTHLRPWSSGYPHAPAGHPPRSFPHSSDVELKLERTFRLDVQVPEGHKLLLVGKDERRGEHVVLDAGRYGVGDALRAGDYRAVLLKDGEIVEETALRLGSLEAASVDLAPYYGFGIETESGEAVALRRAGHTTGGGSGHSEDIRAVVGSSGHTLPGADRPVTLAPGRYEGMDLALLVLPGNNLEVELEGRRVRLFPIEASPTCYEGLVKDEGTAHTLLRFNPSTNELAYIHETARESHSVSGMASEVRTRQGNKLKITPDLRVG